MKKGKARGFIRILRGPSPYNLKAHPAATNNQLMKESRGFVRFRVTELDKGRDVLARFESPLNWSLLMERDQRLRHCSILVLLEVSGLGRSSFARWDGGHTAMLKPRSPADLLR
jgi:hypothetical protein